MCFEHLKPHDVATYFEMIDNHNCNELFLLWFFNNWTMQKHDILKTTILYKN